MAESIWNDERNMMFVERILPVACERLVTIRDNALLIEAAKLFDDKHVNLVVVCNEAGSMVGVVTKTDIIRRISRCHGSGCTVAVATAMTKDVIYCHSGDLLQNIWSIMKERIMLNIPIVGESLRPLGVITARDALFTLLGEAEHEESLLRDYVMGIGYR